MICFETFKCNTFAYSLVSLVNKIFGNHFTHSGCHQTPWLVIISTRLNYYIFIYLLIDDQKKEQEKKNYGRKDEKKWSEAHILDDKHEIEEENEKKKGEINQIMILCRSILMDILYNVMYK